VVEVSGEGSGRVSIAGLLCLKPGHRGRLMWRIRLHRGRKNERGSFSEDDYIAFLDQAHQRLQAPIVLIWTTSTPTSAAACTP
jgi:putative transposase